MYSSNQKMYILTNYAVCMHNMHAFIYMHAFIDMHAFIYACIYLCMHICMHFTCICMHMHAYEYMHAYHMHAYACILRAYACILRAYACICMHMHASLKFTNALPVQLLFCLVSVSHFKMVLFTKKQTICLLGALFSGKWKIQRKKKFLICAQNNFLVACSKKQKQVLDFCCS